jgi:hypothetical protein
MALQGRPEMFATKLLHLISFLSHFLLFFLLALRL